MTLRRIVFLLACCFLLGFSTCQPAPAESSVSTDEPVVVRNGTSFGMCIGYCWTELRIDRTRTVLVSRGWDRSTHPERTYETPTDPDLWKRVQALLDVETIETMDDVYGCPDCADGGAEWVEVAIDGRQKKVTFEYGATLDPIAELTETLRTQRKALIAEADWE